MLILQPCFNFTVVLFSVFEIFLQNLSGSAFDKAFMQGQVQTHQKLHDVVTAYKNASKDMHVKHLTSLALATIAEHTERGQMLVKQLA